MRSLRFTIILLAVTVCLVAVGSRTPPAAAQGSDTFIIAMKELSRSTERVFHEFLEPDDKRLQQASEDMREAAGLTLSAAQAAGFGEQELQDLIYIREDARQVESFVAIGQKGEALSVFYEMVDRCIACHDGGTPSEDEP